MKKLYDKCITWAGHKYSKTILGIVAFTESSIFPVPPDIMIIPMVIAKKNEFIKITLISLIFSVLGGLLGYFIGYIFFSEIGILILEFYGYENINILKEKFSTRGGLISWFGILFVAGFTPIPFKAFTITSGFIHFNLVFFVIACFIARGLRFFLIAFLSYKYGESIGPTLEKKGTQWTIIITVVVLVIIAMIYFLLFKR